MKRLWKWTKRILLACVTLILIAAVAGAVWHTSATRSTERKYPPPGQLIDVGTHKLHCDIEGEGLVVVIETGRMGSSWELEDLQDEVAKFATVVTYDRAGVGWSECGPLPRTTQQVVKELRCMLGKAGLNPPYVLAGGSLGGYYMRYYASKYPEEVAGLVLVDSIATDLLPESHQMPAPKVARFMWLLSATADFGTARLFLPGAAKKFPGFDDMSEEFIQEWIQMKSRTTEVRTTYHEAIGMSNWLEVREEMCHLGDMPVTVLSSTKPGLKWMEPSKKALGSIANDVRKIDIDCGHNIAFERPDIVIDAVKRMVSELEETPTSTSPSPTRPHQD